MNKARKKVIDDIKTKRGRFNNQPDLPWYWKLRNYSEMTWYWINSFNFPVALLIWLITGDYWKALGFFAMCQLYNNAQNLRGLYIHAEHLIEWTIKKTV